VDVRPEGEGERFRLVVKGRDVGELALPLAGAHNVRNALAALAAAAAAGVPAETAGPMLARFGGVRRRLEVRGRASGVTLYDDFAHHPTAVEATLTALRRGRRPTPAGGGAAGEGRGRLVAVFEPRSYTARSRVFQDAFGAALALADRVVVAAVHLPGKMPAGERLSEEGLVEAVRARGVAADFVPDVGRIVETLARELRARDVVVILSNGGFGGIHGRLLTALAERDEPESTETA
jgi:UDP-N-acetylmuramate: L-alanyl-gamma-D-glutamyl-meso-diaminopimelate ligase